MRGVRVWFVQNVKLTLINNTEMKILTAPKEKKWKEVRWGNDRKTVVNMALCLGQRQSDTKMRLLIKKSFDYHIFSRRKEEARQHVNLLRITLQSEPNARIMTFDVETYEHDKSQTLEVGYVITNLDKPEEIDAFHYIIEENLHYSNKDYVPDNRERFKFGTSQRMSLKEAAETFKQHIADADFLVTHAGHNDEVYLSSCGISLEGKQMFDTQTLAMGLLTGGPIIYSLKRLLNDLHIDFDEDILHNAANDAVYTLKVFIALSKKI